jgi:hypothetical protein
METTRRPGAGAWCILFIVYCAILLFFFIFYVCILEILALLYLIITTVVGDINISFLNFSSNVLTGGCMWAEIKGITSALSQQAQLLRKMK